MRNSPSVSKARPTREQLNTAAALKVQYGIPDRVMMVITDQPEGDMKMIWWDKHRCLCINPDGKRRYYEGLQIKI